MSESIWRVVWNLKGTNGPRQSMDFAQEKNVMEWAQGLKKGGASGIFVTELIIGKSVHVDNKETTPAALPFQD